MQYKELCEMSFVRMKKDTSLSEVKQVLVIRSDLKMGKGKIAAQASHASVLATLEAQRHNKIWYDRWFKMGMKKIVVKVITDDELHEVFRKAVKAKLPRALINDAGHTQLPLGTATAVGIGPAPEQLIDPITNSLKLM
ncbi:MAG: peptidyl-tRNA hydrolase Pth2 [Candidatus Kariarchaeaceae archaeon]|jgi:PTH2 family peptidyl-tRNA hydrolase